MDTIRQPPAFSPPSGGVDDATLPGLTPVAMGRPVPAESDPVVLAPAAAGLVSLLCVAFLHLLTGRGSTPDPGTVST